MADGEAYDVDLSGLVNNVGARLRVCSRNAADSESRRRRLLFFSMQNPDLAETAVAEIFPFLDSYAQRLPYGDRLPWDAAVAFMLDASNFHPLVLEFIKDNPEVFPKRYNTVTFSGCRLDSLKNAWRVMGADSVFEEKVAPVRKAFSEEEEAVLRQAGFSGGCGRP